MRALRFLLPLILVLVLVWLGLWWYTQSQLIVGFHHEERKLRQAGWSITHGPINRGQSPLTASATVRDLVIMPPGQPGMRPRINFPRINAHINATAPFTVAVDLPHHFTIQTPEIPEIAVDTDTINFRYHLAANAMLQTTTNPIRSASERITNLRASTGGSNFPIITIGTITSHFINHPDADRDSKAVSVDETVSNIALSPIFVTLIHLPFGGQISRFHLAMTASGPDFPNLFNPVTAAPTTIGTGSDAQLAAQFNALGTRLRPWASHGGHGTFALGLVIGPLHATLATKYKFDQKLQPAGTGSIKAAGLDAFFAAINAAQPRFANILAAASAATAPFMIKGPDGHQQLSIALALQNRTLSLNGKPAKQLPKVNWPPAAPAAP